MKHYWNASEPLAVEEGQQPLQPLLPRLINPVNPISALACVVISLSAIALPPTAQAIPQIVVANNISMVPENSAYGLCLLHQQAGFHCAKKPPRSDPPGGSRSTSKIVKFQSKKTLRLPV